MPLSLDQQNAYRARYAALHPGWQPATVHATSALIREQLKPGMRVLDLGCGRGGALEQLGAAVSHPLGLDPDLTLAGRTPPAGPAACGRDRRTRSRCAPPAWIWCCQAGCWNTCPTRRAPSARLARVLRPGGVFIFLTPGANSPAALLNRALHPLQGRLVPLLYGRAEVDAFPVVYRANTRRHIERTGARGRADLRDVCTPSKTRPISRFTR